MKKTILLFGLVITSVAQQTFGQLLHLMKDNNTLLTTQIDSKSSGISELELSNLQAKVEAGLLKYETVALNSRLATPASNTSSYTPGANTNAALKGKINPSAVAKPPKEFKDLITSYSIFPNPAYADANVRFSLSQPSHVKVAVYNLLGERMRFEGIESHNKYPAGESLVTLNTSALTSGVYLVELIADNTRMVKRLSVVK